MPFNKTERSQQKKMQTHIFEAKEENTFLELMTNQLLVVYA